MKKKSKINLLFKNNKFVLVFSFIVAFIIWCVVVVTVSPQTTRVISDVRVIIDESVSSQFDLVPFLDDVEFVVDVTVTGKKYQISGNQLSKDDLVVKAVTTNVNNAGSHNLQLVCESADGSTFYTIDSISQKTINVFFDKRDTRTFPVTPEVVTNGFPIAAEGFSSGDVNLSDANISITGPVTELNRIDKVVVRHVLNEPLVSNLSAAAQIIPLDKNGNSDFRYLQFSESDIVLTIPVFKIKVLETAVYFKNTPDLYLTQPLEYVVSPHKAEFDTSVDEYANTNKYYVGTIDFRALSPSNTEFEFPYDDPATEEVDDKKFTVSVNLSGYTEEYFYISSEKFVINNPNNLKCTVSDISEVVVVGKNGSVENITEDKISVEINLSDLEINPGECKEVRATVSVDSVDCWIYGTYTVKVSA